MGKATYNEVSAEAKELFDFFMANTKERHHTVRGKYLVGVIKSRRNSVLLYDLERAIRPLIRISNNGDLVGIRDFYTLEEGLVILRELKEMLSKAPLNTIAAGVCATAYQTGPRPGAIGMNQEGRITLGTRAWAQNQAVEYKMK